MPYKSTFSKSLKSTTLAKLGNAPADKPLPANAQQLADLMPALSAKDQEFAASMLANVKRYGSATAKQDYWLNKLIERATAAALGEKPEGEKDKVLGAVGNFAKVYALFALAKSKGLKFPKLRLQVNDATPVVLAVAGERSKKPGVINVSDGGPWGQNRWYGRVAADGTWEPGADYAELPQVAELLKKLGDSPEKTASEYGQLTGYCCFCSRKLDDEKSTAAGFGPTCAAKWGLKDNWKQSKGLFTSLTEKVQADAPTSPVATPPVAPVAPVASVGMTPGQKAAATKAAKKAAQQAMAA